MAPRKNGTGYSYRRHKSSGQAVVSLPRGDGTYKDYLLGEYGSRQSKAEYHRILAEWQARGGRVEAHADITIAELLVTYRRWAKSYYRDSDGDTTREVEHINYAIRPLKAMYAHTIAADFGPLALKACQNWFLELELTRKRINRETHRLRKIFKWAVSEQILPPAVYQALLTVECLKAGRSGAKDGAPVKPVDLELVDKTLPHLNAHVRALVQFMRFTGCRTTEACLLRPCDIDRSQTIWVYRPSRHKTMLLGKERIICIGPRGQELLRPHLDSCGPDEFIYSPQRMARERSAALRQARKTLVQPSQQNRRSRKPKRAPGERYDPNVIGKAVARACDKAGLTRWNPYRLRHTFATMARAAHGIDAAQVALGHDHATITLTYAEKDAALAAKVAESLG